MILILIITSLFILLALLTFFRNILLLFINGVIGLFKKNRQGSDSDTTIRKGTRNKKKKLFSKSEGEYVDFEEVKRKDSK